MRPRLVIAGHIHEAHGHATIAEGIEFYNVSHMDGHYHPVYEPTAIEF